MGYTAISRQLEISVNTVKNHCRRHGMGGRASGGKIRTDVCEQCGVTIVQKHGCKPKRFCCDKCRNLWWNSHLYLVKRRAMYKFICPTCGCEFQRYGDTRKKYCSHECYIKGRFYNE